jgi:hypothetical protein
MKAFPKNWAQIAKLIPTRTITQIRTHAQKCRKKCVESAARFETSRQKLLHTGRSPMTSADNGVVVAEAGEETTWACESILRKRRIAGSKVEYEVGGH